MGCEAKSAAELIVQHDYAALISFAGDQSELYPSEPALAQGRGQNGAPV